MSQISPNDIVYVKYGEYGTMNDGYLPGAEWDSLGIVIEDSNIQIIGYETTPGDLDSADIPNSYTGALYARDGNFSNVPLLRFWSRESTIGIDLNGHDNVVIQNLYITQCKKGIKGHNSRDCMIKNIFVHDVGSLGPSTQGIGIALSGSGDLLGGLRYASTTEAAANIVENCTILNSSYAGIQLSHTFRNTVNKCRVYADDNSTTDSSCDYYFLITGGDENTMTECFAERYRDGSEYLSHTGHGFVISGQVSFFQGSSQQNEYINCEARNLRDAFLLRGVRAKNNLYEDCRSYVTDEQETEATSELWLPGSTRYNFAGKHLGCIQIANGASLNTFRRVLLQNSDVGIDFLCHKANQSWEERTRCFDENNGRVATGNLFESCMFECETAIWCNDERDETGTSESPANPATGNPDDLTDGTSLLVHGTEFVHCTFVGDREEGVSGENAFFIPARYAEDNKLHNCIIVNFHTYASARSRWSANDGIVSGNTQSPMFNADGTVAGFEFDTCCIYNLDLQGNECFPAAYDDGINLYAENPWLDWTGKPASWSPCIDSGEYIPWANTDFYLQSRDQDPDIGAVEH